LVTRHGFLGVFLLLFGVNALALELAPLSVQADKNHLFSQKIPLFGRSESVQTVTLLALTEGRVMQISVADESVVKRGDLLFVLAGALFEKKRANLQQQLQQAETTLRLSRQTLRLREQQKAKKIATNTQLNQAKNAVAAALAQQAAATQALQALQLAARINSPLVGVFTARSVSVGQQVKRGQPLARLISTQIRVRASLFASGVPLLGRSVVLDAGEKHLNATVAAVMPELSAEGAQQVWLAGDELHILTSGQSVSGHLVLPKKALAVPLRAVARDERGWGYVFVQQGNRWRKQRVESGLRDGAWLEIRTGLHGTERVMTQGVYDYLYRDFGQSYQEED